MPLVSVGNFSAMLRDREYLTNDEISKLMATARKSLRYSERNSAMILIGYRHGLRVSELVSLKWTQINWKDERVHIARAKGGKSSIHPLASDELKALRKLKGQSATYVFVSERGGHMSERQFRNLIAALGEKAGLGAIHPHQLRHSCGYALANKGADTRLIQDYLGHRSIASTVRYTELNSSRFEGLWD